MYLQYFLSIKILFKLKLLLSMRQYSSERNDLINNPQVKVHSRMECFHKINTLYYRHWGVSSHAFTPCQIPEKDSNNKHVKGTVEAKDILGPGISELSLSKTDHQQVFSLHAATLNFNCQLLLLCHDHQKIIQSVSPVFLLEELRVLMLSYQ